MSLSIIIPVYKDKKGLSDLLNDIKKKIQTFDFEVILIDDGNQGGLEISNQDNLNIRIIKNETNKGYGYSIKKGVKNSNNNDIAIIDADNSYKIDDLFRLYKTYKEKNVKLIVGKRNFNYSESLPRKYLENFLDCLVV